MMKSIKILTYLQILSFFFLALVATSVAQSPIGLYEVVELPSLGFGSTANGLVFDESTENTYVAGSVTTASGRQIPTGFQFEIDGTRISVFLPIPNGFEGEAVGVVVDPASDWPVYAMNVTSPNGNQHSMIAIVTGEHPEEIITLPLPGIGGQGGEEIVQNAFRRPLTSDEAMVIPGRAKTAEGEWHAVSWTYNGTEITITDLGTSLPPNAGHSTANGIVMHDIIWVVGAAQNGQNKWRPVVWEETGVDGFSPFQLPAPQNKNAMAYGISDSGNNELAIIGDVFGGNNRSRAILWTLPEIGEPRFESLGAPEGFTNSSAFSVVFDGLSEELIAVGSAWNGKEEESVGAIFLPNSETAIEASEILQDPNPNDIIRVLNSVISTPNGLFMSGDCESNGVQKGITLAPVST